MREPRNRTSATARIMVGLAIVVVALPALAGFPGTDLFIPMVGRDVGVYPSNWFTTAWIFNPNDETVSVEIYFLERNVNNSAAVPVIESIAPGETKVFQNIVQTLFGKTAYGALRIKCDKKVTASARVYSQDPSAPLSQSFGQDFAAAPASFAIGLNESAEILGGYTTQPWQDSELRFNMGAVEVTGASATVRWTLHAADGTELDTYDRGILPFGQSQGIFKDYFPGMSSTNARITATVIAGNGKIIAYGSLITNDKTQPKSVQDPTTFEMSYPESALTSAHTTGLFHGAVWSTDGLVVEGGVELELSDAGVVSYSGSAGLECGADLYTLELSDTPASPLTIDGNGDFTGTVTIAYEDAGLTVFTTTWTLTGNLDANGIVTGTLESDTSGGTGDWAACNATNIVRELRAAWTEDAVL